MLIEFTVGNFRSFKEPATLSMAAAKVKARNEKINENNTIVIDENLTLLTSAAIYGANASGKSNLIKAFGFMRDFVWNSFKETRKNEKINVVPFLLDVESEKKPSFFEVVFIKNNIPYRYGFETDREQVISEWLFYSPHKQEAKLFVRDEGEINVSRNFKVSRSAKISTRSNALFLSVATQFNSETAGDVIDWFEEVGLISGLDDSSYDGFTAGKFIEDTKYREEIMRLIRGSDVGINDVMIDKGKISENLPDDMPQEIRDLILKQVKEEDDFFSFKTVHTKRDFEKNTVTKTLFDFDDESEGTQKLFLISGPIIDTLLNGKTLFIDEFEARLHTHLTRKLIQLFNSKTTNPNRAQLIFATHDTNLLSNKLFRRDQIWFVEKDQFGASHLYSLAEIKVEDGKIRNDASFEDDYLQGRYGAVPMLGELRQIVKDSLHGGIVE